ncbi:hypothetical protein PDIG_06540 [Penicillium digitatum PHI26]|uniref:Uncharacterized protein n=2 Tax=Penicillium digitatum TaxID=36651 RepID=K9H1C3_PEND2|nr:hypothetical protein PDIP_11180 [Penicillium digitatum Pd1]EKV18881.1 hypothetical protein PDIG_06540 [Penicillium digitatum PHI26]EKV20890.1 hypothetical protein PDIP_11180 [Penicillium digitatum Pd1]
MSSQCVDGHRKPPKYLNEGTKKAIKAGLHRGVTSPKQAQHEQETFPNTTSYDNKTTRKQTIDERCTKGVRSDPSEEFFDDFVDSSSFDTERSSVRLGRKDSKRSFAKKNDNFMTFFSDAEFATWSERSSGVSDDSEEGTSYQALEDNFGVRLVKTQSYARAEPCSGFAVRSGWSSTFYPHEIEEKSHGC